LSSPDRSRERLEPDRTAVEFFDERVEQFSVEPIKAGLVDLEPLQREARDLVRDFAAGATAYLGEVAHASQQPVRDPGRTPRPARDLALRLRRDLGPHHPCGTLEDAFEIGGGVVLEPGHPTKAIAQGRSEHARARRRADQGEARQIEPDRRGARALADHDVELKIFHRGVEDLLDCRR